ncbi:hypothetical protein AM1H77_07170 [Apilactobacillus micheneri]|nr:hypothetical protein NBRC113063_00124 [Apilactobacillus micheneri]
MIYIIGYMATLVGLLILITRWNNFFGKLSKLEKFAYIIICLGIMIPLVYGFVMGIITNVKL